MPLSSIKADVKWLAASGRHSFLISHFPMLLLPPPLRLVRGSDLSRISPSAAWPDAEAIPWKVSPDAYWVPRRDWARKVGKQVLGLPDLGCGKGTHRVQEGGR